jgi:hypothetical protein
MPLAAAPQDEVGEVGKVQGVGARNKAGHDAASVLFHAYLASLLSMQHKCMNRRTRLKGIAP